MRKIFQNHKFQEYGLKMEQQVTNFTEETVQILKAIIKQFSTITMTRNKCFTYLTLETLVFKITDLYTDFQSIIVN